MFAGLAVSARDAATSAKRLMQIGQPRSARRRAMTLVVVAAALIATRSAVSRVLYAGIAETSHAAHPWTNGPPPAVPARLSAYLREIGAAQEQFRLRRGSYMASVDSLTQWVAPLTDVMLDMTTRGATGWRADVGVGSVRCMMWARDSSLRDASLRNATLRNASPGTFATAIDGVPACNVHVPRAPESAVHATRTTVAHESGFTAADISGTFIEHRADAERSGRASTGATTGATTPVAAHWTAHVDGELKAAVAVAGNQLFVGAHGNGEFAAFTLDSGRLGFRIRAPNWIHHEPAITSELVIVAFGNNENSQLPSPALGSAPSGVVAYDRRTGHERWRRGTASSAMTTPVVYNSLVVAIAGAEAIAWNVRDGRERWRTQLPSVAPMGNAALSDTTLYIALEKATLCALDVRTGVMRYCRAVPTVGWGAGHASVAVAGNTVLMVFDDGVSFASGVRHGFVRRTVLRVLGIPDTTFAGEQVLAAFDAASGAVRWRASLGVGTRRTPGHIAGTPTVSDSTVYVPSPLDGRVVATNLRTGAVRWSTDVDVARGSVTVVGDRVIAATRDATWVVLDARDGHVVCRGQLPGASDRAGLTVAGGAGVLTLLDGTVMVRPVAQWVRCLGGLNGEPSPARD